VVKLKNILCDEFILTLIRFFLIYLLLAALNLRLVFDTDTPAIDFPALIFRQIHIYAGRSTLISYYSLIFFFNFRFKIKKCHRKHLEKYISSRPFLDRYYLQAFCLINNETHSYS